MGFGWRELGTIAQREAGARMCNTFYVFMFPASFSPAANAFVEALLAMRGRKGAHHSPTGEGDGTSGRYAAASTGSDEGDSTVGWQFSATPSLARLHEVPTFLQFNSFIRRGYRSPRLTPKQCIASLAYVHNETVNVLTHLLTLAGMVVLLFTREFGTRGPHFEVLRIAVLSASITMFGSVTYHIFMPAVGTKQEVQAHVVLDALWRSDVVLPQYRRLLMFDIVGVWGVLSVSNAILMYLGFPCHANALMAFVATVIPLAALGLLVFAKVGPSPGTGGVAWLHVAVVHVVCACLPACLLTRVSAATQDALSRGAGFMVLVAARMVVLSLRLSSPSRGEDGALLYLVAEAMTVCGGVLNVARVPERWFPGTLDLLCNSHQIMHLLTGTAIWVFIMAVEKVGDDALCVLFRGAREY